MKANFLIAAALVLAGATAIAAIHLSDHSTGRAMPTPPTPVATDGAKIPSEAKEPPKRDPLPRSIPSARRDRASFHDSSILALHAAGMPEQDLTILESLHKMAHADRYVPDVRHIAFEDDDGVDDDVEEDAGRMILLARGSNSVTAIMNRCVADMFYKWPFRHPDGTGAPEYIISAFAVGGDFFIQTNREHTDWSHRYFSPYPDLRLFEQFYSNLDLDQDGFRRLLRSRNRVRVEPLEDGHDLALVTFEWAPGSRNCFTTGQWETLNLNEPKLILRPILAEFGKFSSGFGVKQLLICSLCMEKIDSQPPEPSSLLNYVPLVAGLLGCPGLAEAAQIVQTFHRGWDIASTLLEDLQALEWTEPPLVFAPKDVRAVSPNALETPKGRVNLAYLQSTNPDAKDFIQDAIRGAKKVVIIPDGRDTQGAMYGHVLLDDGYLNLVLVYRKLAHVWDHHGDGRAATRFALRALRAAQ